MKRRALLAGGLLLPALPAAAEDAYPSRPIQMIVPFPPGGVADITGRPVAYVMGRLLKQSVVVVNKAGAGGSVGAAQAARAAPTEPPAPALFTTTTDCLSSLPIT